MLARGEFELDADIESDTRSLWPAVDALLGAGPSRCLRDATRGGVASVLNELARASGVAMVVRGGDVPVQPAVAGAAEILGIDPMYVANEGMFVAFVAPESRTRRSPRSRRRRLRAGGRDRRGEDGAAGDGAGEHGVRRQARHGPAGRRPAAADLLKGSAHGGNRVRAQPGQDGGDHRPRHLAHDGPQLRGRQRRDDRRHEPEPRGHHHRRDPRHAAGRRAQHGARRRDGAGVHAGLVRRRGRQARPVRAHPRGLDPQREDQRRRLLDRHGREPGQRAADHHQRVDRPAGSRRRRPWSRSAPAPPTAASRR